jgi:hypothetical protein
MNVKSLPLEFGNTLGKIALAFASEIRIGGSPDTGVLGRQTANDERRSAEGQKR